MVYPISPTGDNNAVMSSETKKSGGGKLSFSAGGNAISLQCISEK